ncbi:O-methyltransferase, partial [Salinicoccus siamensis]|uniref:O-methyltransferase n=1 Tax=Salinicoccus siamensis TaxID=381830 RepID=UPI00361C150E
MDIYEYIKEMNTEEELFPEMLAYAQENRVPIMDQDDALSVMKHYIHLSGAKRILEIGTAIGYSAMHMLSVSQDITVVTIEKDQDSHAHAKRFFEMQGVSDRVRSLLADAKEVTPEEIGEQKFDLLFIDASKGNNRNFFDKFSAHVRPG